MTACAPNGDPGSLAPFCTRPLVGFPVKRLPDLAASLGGINLWEAQGVPMWSLRCQLLTEWKCQAGLLKLRDKFQSGMMLLGVMGIEMAFHALRPDEIDKRKEEKRRGLSAEP